MKHILFTSIGLFLLSGAVLSAETTVLENKSTPESNPPAKTVTSQPALPETETPAKQPATAKTSEESTIQTDPAQTPPPETTKKTPSPAQKKPFLADYCREHTC